MGKRKSKETNKPYYRDCPKSDHCKYRNNCPHDYIPFSPFYNCFVKGKHAFKTQQNTEYVVSLMKGNSELREFVKKLKEKVVWDKFGNAKIIYESDIDEVLREMEGKK